MKALPVGTMIGEDEVVDVIRAHPIEIKRTRYKVYTGCCGAMVEMTHKSLLRRAVVGAEHCSSCRNNGRKPSPPVHPRSQRPYKITQPPWPVTTAGINAPRWR